MNSINIRDLKLHCSTRKLREWIPCIVVADGIPICQIVALSNDGNPDTKQKVAQSEIYIDDRSDVLAAARRFNEDIIAMAAARRLNADIAAMGVEGEELGQKNRKIHLG